MEKETIANNFKIISVIASFVIFMFALAFMLYAHNVNSDSVSKNINNYKSLSASFSDDSLSTILQQATAIVKEINQLDYAPDISFRETLFSVNDTDGLRYVSGIIDVDSIKQTYLINGPVDAIVLSCPSPSVSKYPSSFCKGSGEADNNSIDALFGDDLPLTKKLSNNVKIRIYSSDSTLLVHIYACKTDNKSKKEAEEYVKSEISKRGAEPSSFSIKYSFNGC